MFVVCAFQPVVQNKLPISRKHFTQDASSRFAQAGMVYKAATLGKINLEAASSLASFIKTCLVSTTPRGL